MSSDLERLLRRAGEALPEPHHGMTARARARALSAARRTRSRLPIALSAAMLAGCGLGVVLGMSISSGRAASPVLGFGFLPAPDWNVLQSGRTPSPARPAQAIAANVRLSPEDALDELPYSTLLALPPNGVVIVASSVGRRDEPDELYPLRRLPLRLRDAAPAIEWGVQVRPARPLGQYQLRATVNGQALDVHIYFGTERPRRGVLAAAQRQLDRLVVRSGEPFGHVGERALPLRRPTGPSTSVIDRTLLCATTTSGGVHEIELRANAGFRQGAAWKNLAFAVVASGGTRSAATILDDSLAWVAAGKYDHNANLSPSVGLVPTNATRFGSLALNRRACSPAKAQVPLSGKGLRDAAPDALGVSFDCQTPPRVLVRVRAVAYSTPTRYREQRFEKTKAALQHAFLAVRTQAGKQLAFSAVFDTGKVRLAVAPSCTED
jgi:hypothetical protein